MFPGTKAKTTSVGFKRRESGVERVLLTFNLKNIISSASLTVSSTDWILFEKNIYGHV